jgi:hypothetical protein
MNKQKGVSFAAIGAITFALATGTVLYFYTRSKEEKDQAKQIADKLLDRADIVLLKELPPNQNDIWLRFGMSEEEWNVKVKDCIKYLSSSEGAGQIDLTAIKGLQVYGSQVTLKLCSYLQKELISTEGAV